MRHFFLKSNLTLLYTSLMAAAVSSSLPALQPTPERVEIAKPNVEWTKENAVFKLSIPWKDIPAGPEDPPIEHEVEGHGANQRLVLKSKDRFEFEFPFPEDVYPCQLQRLNEATALVFVIPQTTIFRDFKPSENPLESLDSEALTEIDDAFGNTETDFERTAREKAQLCPPGWFEREDRQAMKYKHASEASFGLRPDETESPVLVSKGKDAPAVPSSNAVPQSILENVYRTSKERMLSRSSFAKDRTFKTLNREQITEIVLFVCAEQGAVVNIEEVRSIVRLVEMSIPGRAVNIAAEMWR